MDSPLRCELQNALGSVPPSYVFSQALVTQVLSEASQGKLGRCSALGFSPELVQRLQALSPVELHQLFMSPFMWIKHSVDARALERVLEKINRDEERERLINRVLRLGATSPMMTAFFGLSHTESAERRRAMGVQVKAGRMPALTDEQRYAIWERWVSLVRQYEEGNSGTANNGGSAALGNTQTGAHLEDLNQLDLMLLIAEEQSVAVAQIWAELNKVQQAEDD